LKWFVKIALSRWKKKIHRREMGERGRERLVI
jgi:hypothetical protein